MKIIKILSVSFLLVVFLNSCQDEKSEQEVVKSLVQPAELKGDVIPGSYIVMFKESEMPTTESKMSERNFTSRLEKSNSYKAIENESKEQINLMLAESKFDKSKVSNYYTTQFNGVSLKNITSDELKEISKNPKVKAVYFDQMVNDPNDKEVSSGNSVITNKNQPQVVPCGILNAGGFVDGANPNLWIWVVDSGVDTDHPDLNIITNPLYAKTYVDNSIEDCNGHGTHIAGTAAAKNNGIGVVGVSAGASVVPVRVFGCQLTTSVSTVLAAINHVGAYDIPGDVVNLSLGGFFGPNCNESSPYTTALRNLANSGTRIAIAAGNSAANATEYTPACVKNFNIFTVASMTCNQTFSSFSNFDRGAVDFITTGSSVYSTWLNGGYNTISGTSMACPHVVGILHALNNSPNQGGNVFGPDGNFYPIATR